MRKRLTDKAIVRGYTRLSAKVSEIQGEIRQLLQILTTPVKLTQNERLILLRLPTHLIKTYFTLQTFKKATATQVSEQTGKARAVESAYLNQLAMMGFCLKNRDGREVAFWCNIEGAKADRAFVYKNEG
jgi:regulator of PEP synthase PpsR (kinase-PPPase family)